MQNRRDAGQDRYRKVGCTTGRMQDSWDAGKVGCKTGGMQDWWDAGQVGCSTTVYCKVAEKEGCKKRGLKD